MTQAAPQRALIIGDESLTLDCARQWLEAGHEIAAVVTRKAELAEWARDKGILLERPGMDLAARTEGLAFDWLLSIANLQLLPEALLTQAKNGAVNFHDALLPRYAGLNAPVWARIAGETRHGITWHMITLEVDRGDILVQRSFDISEADTGVSLNTKCYAAAIESFGEVITSLEQGATERVAQDFSKRSYVGRFDRPEAWGALRVDQSREAALRMVRALDHGSYANPIAVAKLWDGASFWTVSQAEMTADVLAPGAYKRVGADEIALGFADGALRLSGLRAVTLGAAALADTGALPVIDEALAQTWKAQAEALARNEARLTKELIATTPLAWPVTAAPGEMVEIKHKLPKLSGAQMAELTLHFGRVSCGQMSGAAALVSNEGAPVASGWLPFESEDLPEEAAVSADLLLRSPELRDARCPDVALSLDGSAIAGPALTLAKGALWYDSARVAAPMAELLAERLVEMAKALAKGKDMPTMSAAEHALVTTGWNDTAAEYDRAATMADAFDAQVKDTPDAPALVAGAAQLSYAELDARANQVAHVLIEMGVRPGALVGLCTARSAALVIGALAIHKAGAAYVPMDPAYPRERLALFVEDSGADIILTESAVRDAVPAGASSVLVLDGDARIENADAASLPCPATPEDLAYVIFTSGSTGRPKGVMVEHRNVINFFAGMDARVPTGPQDCWLALTSLSFDISVLEIFYTLARGAKVVLVSEQDRLEASKGVAVSDQEMAFSLYYWGNDDGVGRDKYTLLLEGAKFADQNGFCAVWTPERHFHAFGGPYPNPSVTGAAVAAVTQNIGVRAGSCVAPLHHTARIAEEWAVIDNLTGGRAGLAIASGWQPDDFVLRPENTPPENKPAMLRQIEDLRALWKGEEVAFPRLDGKMHGVVTQPRPVSKEVPIWVTTAGNPATWKEAGKIGANVLTHLLGQSVDEVAQKIGIYHAALREAGHDPADFQVTLMLHTYLADTREEAREVAREPMKDYLRAAAGLIKQYAWAFPAFKRPEGVNNAFDLDLEGLSDDEMDAILDFAFERYYTDSGLFGTVEDAVARVESLKKIGVTEVACLIDYGIARETVLEGLRPLARVVAEANSGAQVDPEDRSIAAQIRRHSVSHMQCTPSMGRLLLGDPDTRAALGGLKQILLGGEALPGALVAEFSEATSAPIENMYGPTETTIWSTTAAARADQATAPIGAPIANTQVYVLDDDMAPVPVGVEGELWIGGDGVTRGYWQRDDLTAERFPDNPFGAGRLYRTGDLVRWQGDGTLAFVGRADGQVKLRGHRIELGEIEAQLTEQPGVEEAVCIVRDGRDLVGYVRGSAEPGTLRQALSTALPGYMVPGHIAILDAFPLTPNKKIDRKALPDPSAVPHKPIKVSLTNSAIPRKVVVSGPGPADATLLKGLSTIWSNVLGVENIQPQDNFFDLGGHSLLAVQAHRAMRSDLGAAQLSIADVFGHPTLEGLAKRIADLHPDLAPGQPERDMPVPANSGGAARGDKRRDAIARRREMRARRAR